MNGVHDMGGMHGMGPISHEANEPVFHADGKAGYTRWIARSALSTNGPWMRGVITSKLLLPPTICE